MNGTGHQRVAAAGALGLRLLWATPLGLAALLACNRPSDSLRTNTSSPALSEAVDAGPGSTPAVCSAEPATPPFGDGAWSVRSLVCAKGTLKVGERLVLRAVPSGGNNCSCPENVPCAPCMPYVLFRDTPSDTVFVTLRGESPEGLVPGVRVDVPVRLSAWGSTPPAALAEVVWAR